MKKTGQPYATWQPEEDYDAVVIGSGIGGLGVAALLAKHGDKKVLVLERHTKAGGFTHAFSRKDWDWDVGLHYIGEMHREGSMLWRLFDEVSDGTLEWEPMGEVYDTVVIGDRRWEYVAGRDAWRERMHSYFPEERAAIDHSNLKAVLAAQFGDHGLPPNQASFAIHAMIFNHYLGGAAYPVGGASRIAATVAPVIEEAGGSIVVCAEVASVVVDGGRAVGVRMADGREIRAPLVVSDAGVPNTVMHLLPEGTPGRESLRATMQHTTRSASHICLYVGLDGTDEDLGLDRSNLWVYHSADQDGYFARYLAVPEALLPLAYISFPSAKDPDFARRHPGKATIEVVSFAPYERFRSWEDTKWMKRGGDYETVKEGMSQRLLDVLEREVPQVAGKISHHELSTPLSTRHFSAYDEGEIYGLEHTPARFREKALRPQTGLKGFFLTGQDVCTAGIAGALFGAVLSASAILRRNLLGKISRERG